MNQPHKLNRPLRRGIIVVALLIAGGLIASWLLKRSQREKLPEPVVFVTDTVTSISSPAHEDNGSISGEGIASKRNEGAKKKNLRKRSSRRGKKSEKKPSASKPAINPRNPLRDTIPTLH